MDFSWPLIWQSLPVLLSGAWMTVKLTTLAVGMGFIIGTFAGLGRIAHSPLWRGVASVYVDFIRGTPLLVQIFLVYMGLPQIIGRPIDPYLAGVAALSINSGAYVAEIVRAGIQSVDRGQMEAARSLGLSYGSAMRFIILPQAFKRIIPPLGNEFIAMLKDSSLVSAISLEELLRKGQLIIGRTLRPFEILITVALIYLVMTLAISRLVAWSERRLKVQQQL